MRADRLDTDSALALTPFALIRDLVDLPFRLLNLPLTFTDSSHAGVVLGPLAVLPILNDVIVFAGTTPGRESGLTFILDPVRCDPYLFPNTRDLY